MFVTRERKALKTAARYGKGYLVCEGYRNDNVVLCVENYDGAVDIFNMMVALESKIVFFNRVKEEPVKRWKHVADWSIYLIDKNKIAVTAHQLTCSYRTIKSLETIQRLNYNQSLTHSKIAFSESYWKSKTEEKSNRWRINRITYVQGMLSTASAMLLNGDSSSNPYGGSSSMHNSETVLDPTLKN